MSLSSPRKGGKITPAAPAAIAAILGSQFAEDDIASALAELRASGEYDDEVARGVAMRSDATNDTD